MEVRSSVHCTVQTVVESFSFACVRNMSHCDHLRGRDEETISHLTMSGLQCQCRG